MSGTEYYDEATNSQGTVDSNGVFLTVNAGGSGNAFDAWGLPNTPTSPTQAVTNFAYLQSYGEDIWPDDNGPAAGANETTCSPTCTTAQGLYMYVGARWQRGDLGPNVQNSWHNYMITLANAINTANPNWHFKYSYFLNGGNYTTSSIGNGANPAAGTEMAAIVDLYNSGNMKFVESANEVGPNCLTWNGVTYGGAYNPSPCPGSQNGVAQFNAYTWNQMRANPSLNANVAISTVTYAGGEWDNACKQYGTVIPSYASCIFANGIGIGTHLADILAAHPYLSTPGSQSDNIFWDTFSRSYFGNGHGFYGDFNQSWGPYNYPGLTVSDLQQRPAVATEYGYVSPGAPYTGTFNATVQAQTQLVLLGTGFFSGCLPGATSCTQGLKAGSFYGFVDNDGGYPHDDGIYSTSCGQTPNCPNPVFTPKLAATAIHNMMTTLYDTTSNFTPGSANWSISGCGTGGVANISVCHGGLMQNSSGHFFLLVWADTGGEGETATVNLGASYGHVNVYSPIISTAVQSTHNSTQSFNVVFPAPGLQIVEFY
jgi:hypothetical protein